MNNRPYRTKNIVHRKCWYCHESRRMNDLTSCTRCTRWFCKGDAHTLESNSSSHDPSWIKNGLVTFENGLCAYCCHSEEGRITDSAELNRFNKAIFWLVNEWKLDILPPKELKLNYLCMEPFKMTWEGSNIRHLASKDFYSSPLQVYIAFKQATMQVEMDQAGIVADKADTIRQLKEFGFKCYSALLYCYRCVPTSSDQHLGADNGCAMHGLVWAHHGDQYHAGKVVNYFDHRKQVHVHIFGQNKTVHELALKDCLLFSGSDWKSTESKVTNRRKKGNKENMWQKTPNGTALNQYEALLKQNGFKHNYAKHNVELTRKNIVKTYAVKIRRPTTTIKKATLTAPVIELESEESDGDSVILLENDNDNVNEASDHLAQLAIQDRPAAASLSSQSNSSHPRIKLLSTFEKPEYFVCACCVGANTKPFGSFEHFLEHLLDKRGIHGQHHIGVISYENFATGEENLEEDKFLVEKIEGYHLDKSRLKFELVWFALQKYRKQFSKKVKAQFYQKKHKWVAATDITADMSSKYMQSKDKTISEPHDRRGIDDDLVDFNKIVQKKDKIVAVIGSNVDGSKIFVERGNMGNITVHNRNGNTIEVTRKLTKEERAIIDRYFAGEGRSANVPTGNAF